MQVYNYKLPISTIEKEKTLGLLFSNISDISSCLIFANSRHVQVYGGDDIGYTYLRLKKAMPLNAKKVYIGFHNRIYQDRKKIRKDLEEKYGDIDKLSKENKLDSLKNFTKITLTISELCMMLNKKVTKETKKTSTKMIVEFSEFLKNETLGVCKTHNTKAFFEPIFYGFERIEKSKYIEFYFVDFFIIQTLLSKRPLYVTKKMFNARSDRTYMLSITLLSIKYLNIMNIQNGTYNTISIRNILEVCDIGEEEYKEKGLTNFKKTIRKLVKDSLYLIDEEATFEISNERTYEKFIRDGKVTFKIPMFDERISFLKEYINKHQEKIESSIYRQTIKLQEEIIELNTAKYVSDEEKEKIIDKSINIISKEFDKNKCK